MPAGYIVLKIDSFSAKKKFARSIDQNTQEFFDIFLKTQIQLEIDFQAKKGIFDKKKIFGMVKLPKHFNFFETFFPFTQEFLVSFKKNP